MTPEEGIREWEKLLLEQRTYGGNISLTYNELVQLIAATMLAILRRLHAEQAA